MTEPIVDVLRDFAPADESERRELALLVHETREAAVAHLAKTLPLRYAHADVTHPDVVAWVRAVAAAATKRRAYMPPVVQHGPSLLLLGLVGSGKTHQGWGAIRAFVLSGLKVSWQATTAADLYARMRPRPGVDTESVFEVYAHAPLLLIDDLGAAKRSEWTEEVNYRLINHRYERRLPTLITSNVGRDMELQLGKRVTSRLREMATRVYLEGEDRRSAPTAPVPLPLHVDPPPEVEGVPMPDSVRADMDRLFGNKVPAGRTHADPNQHAAFRDRARDELARTEPAEIPEETQ